jgi:hypothetical protein
MFRNSFRHRIFAIIRGVVGLSFNEICDFPDLHGRFLDVEQEFLSGFGGYFVFAHEIVISTAGSVALAQHAPVFLVSDQDESVTLIFHAFVSSYN